jgi:hypothetical protein
MAEEQKQMKNFQNVKSITLQLSSNHFYGIKNETLEQYCV